jgi:glycerophosphoryl diester phosphodiesterase
MKTPVLLVHHAANRGYVHPPSSLRGLRACLEAGARVVEVDVIPLAGGDFALLHDERLDESTNGSGLVSALTADQVRRLRHTWQGTLTDEPVGLLSQAIALLLDHAAPSLQELQLDFLSFQNRSLTANHAASSLQELQLDFKPGTPPADAVLRDLLRAVEPVKERVRVTCGEDWVLRRLRVLDSDLALGFDPLLYLEIDADPAVSPEETPDPLPFRVGAYGYRDDHPLALRVWGTTADYLAARAETLAVLPPPGGVWYIHGSLLARVLDDGADEVHPFDWIAYLHARSIQVDVWTLDAGRPGHVELARRLIAAGVDRITTNDAPCLAEALRASEATPHRGMQF